MYRLEYDNLTNIFIILALTWNGFIPQCWLVWAPLLLRSGYRVYRDNNLIYPLSNAFVGTPMVVGFLGSAVGSGQENTGQSSVGPSTAGSDQVTVELTAEASGSAWVGELRNGCNFSRAKFRGTDCDYKISRVTFPTKMRENMRKSRWLLCHFFPRRFSLRFEKRHFLCFMGQKCQAMIVQDDVSNSALLQSLLCLPLPNFRCEVLKFQAPKNFTG